MQRSITIRNVDIRLNMEEVFKHAMDITSGLRDKEILAQLIQQLSLHNIEAVKIMSQTSVQMKEIARNFYMERVEEYRQSQKLKKILGFTSSAQIEKKANEHALADVQQLINIMTGSDDKVTAFSATNSAIQSAVAQLISLVSQKAVNFNTAKISKMLETDNEV
ncbi:MAG: hypothetical protein WBB67_12190 [bacterium]